MLAEQGFRFIYRRGDFKWVHLAEVREQDEDLTDLSDDEFEAFVFNVNSDQPRLFALPA